MNAITLESSDIQATHDIGRRMGAHLACGHVLALVGPLGSGKTTLVKGIAEGAGVANLRQVNSPTFVIVNEYEAGSSLAVPLRIYHIDTYRLRGSDDLESLEFDEMCATGAVVIEWADRVSDLLPPDALHVTIEPVDATHRRLHCTATDPATRELLRVLSSDG